MFERTLANGSDSTTNRSLDAEAFRYVSTGQTYRIERDEEVHYITTSSMDQCSIG
ncbi:hypothetical protein [Haloarchaeobius sp. DT45]|uniref:hypothetical protein n=1 Tax=Haloarchaeobius sp. DT45 TaxID=3446116 RepID=UPI003F6ABFF5